MHRNQIGSNLGIGLINLPKRSENSLRKSSTKMNFQRKETSNSHLKNLLIKRDKSQQVK
jgi:hypothetical protein